MNSHMEINHSSDGTSPVYACLDLDSDPDQVIVTPAPKQYETIYVTSHKAPCRAGDFSPDGMLIATGSADASIKILDVERMISKSTHNQQHQQHHQQHQQQLLLPQNNDGNSNSNNNNETAGDSSHLPHNNDDQEHLHNQDSNNGIDQQQDKKPQQQQHQFQHQGQGSHPVIRTLYDHSEEVTFLKFHPTAPILASGSQDMTIKLYEYLKASAKRAYKTIQEASPVRCFAFHPGGSYMLVGCQQPTLRLYDVNTSRAFVSSNPLDQHSSPITMIDYSKNGSFYVSGSKDGDIKIWDGVSNRCVSTFKRAHDGAVCSVKVSRNDKYILSAGKDSLVKLWEMSMCSCLMVYEGAPTSSAKNLRAQALFNHTEDYILYPDNRNLQLHSWNARTGKHLESLNLGHNNSVRFIAHSSVNSSFVTCSEDFRARFWSMRENGSNKLD